MKLSKPYLRLFKYCLIRNFCRECFKSLIQYVSSDLLFFTRLKSRIAKRVRYSDRRHDSVRSNCQRNRYYSTKVNNRDSCSFNFFNHRCTATRTSSSGGGQDNRSHSISYEFFGKILCKSFGVFHCRAVTYCGIEVFVQAAYLSFSFKFSQYIYRNNSV